MNWEFDKAHTSVEATGKHMMVTKVRVRFPNVSGEVTFEPARPEGGAVWLEIPVASLESGDPRRDAHLRSADFFDADSYPRIEFRSAGVRPVGGGRYAVAGHLTIRGATRPVTVDVAVHGPIEDVAANGRQRIFIEATARIDRRDWGLIWNMPVPQGVLVSNEIGIELSAELVSAVPVGKAA